MTAKHARKIVEWSKQANHFLVDDVYNKAISRIRQAALCERFTVLDPVPETGEHLRDAAYKRLEDNDFTVLRSFNDRGPDTWKVSWEDPKEASCP